MSIKTMLCGLLLAVPGLTATAQTTPPYLSAAESDPLKMGWMQGSPPPPDKVLHVADGSFFKFPALRWSVVHMREFLPTVNVSPGLGAPVLSWVSGQVLFVNGGGE